MLLGGWRERARVTVVDVEVVGLVVCSPGLWAL